MPTCWVWSPKYFSLGGSNDKPGTYCSLGQVWDPYLLEDIDLLERTLKFVLRVCYKDCSPHCSDLFDLDHIPTLVERHNKAKLTCLYKIVLGLIKG